tara:strand:+ start:1578 stop:2984 length:1407 start_codon:yes stop_codon:yes gene_type:complete
MSDNCQDLTTVYFTEDDIDQIFEILDIKQSDLEGLSEEERMVFVTEVIENKKSESDQPEYRELLDSFLKIIMPTDEDNNFSKIDDVYKSKIKEQTEITQEGNAIIQGEPEDVPTVEGDITKGKINPTQKSIITRTINIDSQYRADQDTSTTNYTVTLSEELKGVVSLSLSSIEVPFTWYTFEYTLGTSSFWVDKTEIIIEDGTYSQEVLIEKVSDALIAANKGTGATYNKNNGHCILNISGEELLFYDIDNTVEQSSTNNCIKGANNSAKKNYNLGVLLGFKGHIYTSDTGSIIGDITSENIVSVSSNNYLLLVVDDFKSSRLNNGLVSTVKIDQNLNIPSYFTDDIEFICENGKQVPVGSAPRENTEAQLYTINEIIQNRSQQTEHLLISPTTTDVLARISIDQRALMFGDVYTLSGSMISGSKREYFGPVDIGRLEIRLLDCRGNELKLHGSDWSICLTVEQLYQY